MSDFQSGTDEKGLWETEYGRVGDQRSDEPGDDMKKHDLLTKPVQRGEELVWNYLKGRLPVRTE